MEGGKEDRSHVNWQQSTELGGSRPRRAGEERRQRQCQARLRPRWQRGTVVALPSCRRRRRRRWRVPRGGEPGRRGKRHTCSPQGEHHLWCLRLPGSCCCVQEASLPRMEAGALAPQQRRLLPLPTARTSPAFVAALRCPPLPTCLWCHEQVSMENALMVPESRRVTSSRSRRRVQPAAGRQPSQWRPGRVCVCGWSECVHRKRPAAATAPANMLCSAKGGRGWGGRAALALPSTHKETQSPPPPLESVPSCQAVQHRPRADSPTGSSPETADKLGDPMM